ncbi:hypothetical protein M0802_008061 [Mischocyttarus mexicanus]|nr:hypothetical protein M0802_008061 [Mischocyttarus mexicanus]
MEGEGHRDKEEEEARDYEDYGKADVTPYARDITRTCNFTITANLLTLENSRPNCWVSESEQTSFAASAIMLNSLNHSKRPKRALGPIAVPSFVQSTTTIILILSFSAS